MICPQCKKRECAPDRKMCRPCLDYFNEKVKAHSKRTDYAAEKALIARRRNNGLCIWCKEPCGMSWRCTRCQEKHTAAMRAYRSRNKITLDT